MMRNQINAADRCQGVLVGLAAGDRIGGPIRMAVRLAESLLDCGDFNPSDILNRYLSWWREGAFDTGPVSGRAFALMVAGMPVQAATTQVHREFGGMTAGCNPTHRSPPLSMLAAIADEDLTAFAKAEAGLTHHDPVAGEIAATVNKLCRAMIAVVLVLLATGTASASSGFFAGDSCRGKISLEGGSHQGLASVSGETHRGCADLRSQHAAGLFVAPKYSASLGKAASTDYKATFFKANPTLEEKVVVHHAIEQQVMTRYPGVITEAELHSLENLRGIPKGINSDVHLSKIRKEWNEFYRTNPTATKGIRN
jgi:hypothetical protein